MEKTGTIILFLYTCMCSGATAGSTGKIIGQGITVKVQAYYDDSFKYNKNETQVRHHFDGIFSEIQKYLNERLVGLKFTVQSASLMNNLTLNDTTQGWRQINGNATLENLKSFAESQEPSLDTISYFFTSTPIAENSTHRAEDVFTPNTFCTENVTATVLQTVLVSEFYQTALKETIFMLGPRHTQSFSEEEFAEMNRTFSKCLEKKH
ncbi:uncharacterized protein LOC142563812 [Dermacentor variabilis]|uniref:uncharacterized protein LOC142563812 n=1 Tax=Dermacentor variabilis TaxID=34621 RepID=UPI003F5C0170